MIELGEGRSLKGADLEWYQKHQSVIDNHLPKFQRFLREVGTTDLIKGWREGYYPHRAGTVGAKLMALVEGADPAVMEWLKKATPEEVTKRFSSLDEYRQGSKSTVHDAYKSQMDYVRNVYEKMHQRGFMAEATARMGEMNEPAKGVMHDYVTHQTKGTHSPIDAQIAAQNFAKILKEPMSPGMEFKSSGTMESQPKGRVKVLEQSGVEERGPFKGEPMFSIEVDGKPYQLNVSATTLKAWKYSDLASDSRPVTRAVHLLKRSAAALYIAFNSNPVWRGMIENPTRMATSGHGARAIIKGSINALKVATGKASPELMQLAQDFRDYGITGSEHGGVLEGETTAASRVGKAVSKAAYAGVQLPDDIARNIMGHGIFADLQSRFKGKPRDWYLTETALRVQMVTDMNGKATQTEAGANPFVNLASFLNGPRLNVAGEVATAVREGRYAAAAAKVGVPVAAIATLAKILSGTKMSEKEYERQMLDELASAVPFGGTVVKGDLPLPGLSAIPNAGIKISKWLLEQVNGVEPGKKPEDIANVTAGTRTLKRLLTGGPAATFPGVKSKP